jgi:hypothetical protein
MLTSASRVTSPASCPRTGVSASYSRTAGETVGGSPYTITASHEPGRRARHPRGHLQHRALHDQQEGRHRDPQRGEQDLRRGRPSFTGNLSRFLPADGASASYSRTAGETVGGSLYTITASLSPTAVLGNYEVNGSGDPSLTGTLTGSSRQTA